MKTPVAKIPSNNDPATKPSPGARTAARIADAGARKAERLERIEVDVAVRDGIAAIEPAHSDATGWQDVLFDSFGTTSQEFVNREIGLIGNAQRNRGDHVIGPTELNAVLAAIDGTSPENEMAAMLASQMAVTHALAMEMLGRTRRAESISNLESYGSLATKLSRTFVAQTEALAKLRRGGEQTVRVEHVHVYPGGQAIVGSVSNGAAGSRGSRGKGRQTDGTNDSRTLGFTPGAEVLGAQSSGQSVPETGCEGQEALPAAWRR